MNGTLTIQEAAEKLGVNPQTVRNWCRLGIIPGAFKIGKGRFWRIKSDELYQRKENHA